MTRSHLYVPGNRPDVLTKAVKRGADALIVDLEDAVPPAGKNAARQVVAKFLASAPPAASRRARASDSRSAGPVLWVRVNPGEAARADLAAVLAPSVAGICLAKAESAEDVARVAGMLDGLEPERGIEPGTVAISPLLESASAVLRAAEIAAAPRVSRLQVGESDLSADIGAEIGPDERELWWVRAQVVLVSAACGIEPPVGPVSTNFRDLDALRESTTALRRMGYRGRACIHPAQLDVVNEVFTPTPEQLDRARELVARFDAALAAGEGTCTDDAGRMIDLAVVRAARRTLAAVAAQ